MNMIGYETVILSNHINRSDLIDHPIITANGCVVAKLSHLKNVGIKITKSYLRKNSLHFNPNKLLLSEKVNLRAIPLNNI